MTNARELIKLHINSNDYLKCLVLYSLFGQKCYVVNLTKSMVYATRRCNALYTRALQESLSSADSTQFLVMNLFL